MANKESCSNCISQSYCGRIEWRLREVKDMDKAKEIMGKTAKLCRHYGKEGEGIRKQQNKPLFS